MPTSGPNGRLVRLIADAGFTSHKSLARAVVEESALVNGPFVRCDHTDVARWIRGMTPRGSKPAIIAAAISRRLGRKVTLADIGMASSAAVLMPHLGLSYPETVQSAANAVAELWHADLSETHHIVDAQLDPAGWKEASLRWLITSGDQQPDEARPGTRVGITDVTRFRQTVEMFDKLDGRFGGGHVRQALVQYLATDGERLLRGRFTTSTGISLYSAVAEATLLAAWMAYDSAPRSGLAQRYFIQALALSAAGENRLLGASILDAMSHQATFTGRYRDAADLAVAARSGTQNVATATLTAHFFAMEARAYARLGDAKACDIALSETYKAFSRRSPADDPDWMKYFDEGELAAEAGHCARDLGRQFDTTQYANQCLKASDRVESPRSHFFATMVLADAYLGAGEVEQGCTTALRALEIGESIRSARCVKYVREFSELLASVKFPAVVREFNEEARNYRLWRIASQPISQ